MRAGGERAYRVIEQVAGHLVWENDSLARGVVRNQPVWIEHVHGDRQSDRIRIYLDIPDVSSDLKGKTIRNLRLVVQCKLTGDRLAAVAVAGLQNGKEKHTLRNESGNL